MEQTILVVDDEREIADLVEVYLKNEGFPVLKAYTAAEALEIIAQKELSLAILDVMLPDMDGFTLCQKIRESHLYPILMLSAKVEDMDKIMGLTLGADDYITKPFSPLELVARVKTQLRRYTRYNTADPREQERNEHDFRGLFICQDSHQCTLNGEDLTLTPIEFNILWYLCEHRGKVVSSEELFEAVWKEKYMDGNNTVMAHIARLREKMKEPSRKPKFIKTVWGWGIPLSKRRLLWPPRRKRHNQISQQILIRYVFSVLGMIGGLVLLFFLGWVFCRLFIWQPHEPLYRLLKALEDTAMFWGSGVVLLGVFLLTYRSISKPLDYLDEVIEAAEELAHPADTPIRLSPPLESIQDELNIVREGALRSAMYAKEAEQRKNDLIVYLAHDLKTPLTSVIGYLSLLRDEPQISPEMRAKYTGIALEKAERLEALINEFFEITRFNLTQLSLRLEEVNLTRLLEQVTFEFQPILAEKGLSLSLQFTPDVILACDPEKLERVFDNLLRNAVNYSNPNTPIGVTMLKEKDTVIVSVENQGRTIPQDKLDQIFEQFFRLDSSRSSSSGGAGLGLAIAKEIVERHNGIIRAQSAKERITFTVTLPLTQPRSS